MAPKCCPSSPNFFIVGLLILYAISIPAADALGQSLCSTQNTGVDDQVFTDNYQSNGKCFDTCKANYAFAVVQGKNCWCSNYAPADTSSLGSCSSPCPGFPYEQCGSSEFFGYIPLNKAPLGTAGGSQSQSSTSSPVEQATSISQVVSSPASPYSSSRPSTFPVRPSSSTSPIAVDQLSSRTFLGLSTSSQLLSFVTSVSSFPQVLTPSVQTPPTPKPVTVQQTVTASPSVKISLVSITPSTTPETTTETTTTSTPAKPTTRYVPLPVIDTTTSSPSPRTSQTSQTPKTLSTSSTSSAIASDPSSSSTSTWTPTPITSVMTVTGQVKTITITPTAPSTAIQASQPPEGGFMSHPGKVAGLFVGVGLIICLAAAALIWFCLRRKRDAEAETIASTTGGETPQRRQSKLSTIGLLGGTRRSNRKSVPKIQTSGWGAGNSTEKSPTDTPIDYRRTSYPRIVDQRLEPAALWNPLQDNGSHVSIQSFRDDQDYSRRMLRVANPDDRPVSRD